MILRRAFPFIGFILGATLSATGCTEGRLLRDLKKAPMLTTTGSVNPAFGAFAGGGRATGAGVQLDATVGEVAYSHRATGAGVQLRSGIKSVY
jgi:hypothetical protein